MISKSRTLHSIVAIVGLTLLPGQAAWAQGDAGDDAFAAAREAFVKGNRARLERALAALESHPLAAWGEYFRLVQRLEDGEDAGVADFLARHEGSYLAEKMRGDWLKWLARREAWNEARGEYARLRQPDAETVCHGLDIRLRLGENEARGDAHALLAADAALPEACMAPLGRLAAAGEFATDEIWERLRRQLALGRLKEARVIAGWLPAGEAPSWRAVEAIVDHPARHLAKLPERFADTRRERELAMFAALRMARSDVRVAAARWQDIESRFGASERAFVRARLALGAALGHLPEAADWFEQALALGATLSEEQHAWRVRAVLRAEDWPAVARAIDGLPADMAARPEWAYWRARAHLAAGEREAAHAAFARIAGQPDFYGILAGEALGRPFAPPPRAQPTSPEELAEAHANFGLVRGLALLRAGMRIEGLREWNWALKGAGDRQLLAAAELARHQDVIDRAIHAADRTRHEHDFHQRYPTPFLDQVAPRVRDVDLDPAWVYGLMRQESRFIMDARSSVGAKGLMQLMPATAKWVAKKIGMTHFHPAKVTEMDVNITLGTNYMRMVMDSLDDHPVLASAAYNAGPGRARKWRAERPIEGAIYAETIPFNETRDYVKKVLANATVYAALAGEAAPSLTARLGTVRPRGFGDGTAEALP
jgi:soluble lytic murein transglycosylase